MRNQFKELGHKGSNIYFAESLISERLANKIRTVALSTGQISKYGDSKFASIAVGPKSNCGGLTFGTIFAAIHNRISTYSHLAIGRKVNYVPPSGNAFTNSTIKIQKIGEFHEIHSDAYPWEMDGDANEFTTMSSIIGLGGDFDGGQLVFDKHSVSVTMKCGAAIFFPSMGYEHQVNAVSRGERITLIHFWMEKNNGS